MQFSTEPALNVTELQFLDLLNLMFATTTPRAANMLSFGVITDVWLTFFGQLNYHWFPVLFQGGTWAMSLSKPFSFAPASHHSRTVSGTSLQQRMLLVWLWIMRLILACDSRWLRFLRSGSWGRCSSSQREEEEDVGASDPRGPDPHPASWCYNMWFEPHLWRQPI